MFMKKNIGDILNGKTIMAMLFLLILVFFFFVNMRSIFAIAKTEIYAVFHKENMEEFLMPSEVESTYDANFYNRMKFVDVNGAVNKVLGKKLMNGAIKDKNGQLNLENNTNYKFSEDTEMKKSERAIKILEFAKTKGADILYVQRPWKNSETADSLPYGIPLQYGKQFDFWCERMDERNIPVLDLRRTMNSKELEFYKTDHHWTTRSSLIAADKIICSLNNLYNMNLDESMVDIDNYNSKIYTECFLGSEGIKTGKYYVGKDDFEVLWPDFDTNIKYIRYDNAGPVETKSGDFKEAFIRMDLVKDKNYNNKYAAYTFDGYVENRIYNINAENDLKVLLISDSFSRPMVTFFSLCFSETRYLDPQEGRYTDSYVKYIDAYKPDVVVMMFSGDGTFENV